MKLVLTNDDGVDAPGIAALRALCLSWPEVREVVVVAPDRPRSSSGHTVSVAAPLTLEERAPGIYGLSGTPADCSRVALTAVARDADWVVAGINQGANLGVDTLESGTVAAAREAVILGRPAIAISQYVRRHGEPDWAKTSARAGILRELLAGTPAPGTLWNVNLPDPADGATEVAVVHCPVDPAPCAVRYEREGNVLRWHADYHVRPRTQGHDIAVCFGGATSVSAIYAAPHGPT